MEKYLEAFGLIAIIFVIVWVVGGAIITIGLMQQNIRGLMVRVKKLEDGRDLP